MSIQLKGSGSSGSTNGYGTNGYGSNGYGTNGANDLNGGYVRGSYNGYAGANNILPANVTAVSTTGAITNHLMDMYSGVIGNDDEGNYTIYTNKENEASTTSANGKFVAFDVFLKVDKDNDLFNSKLISC